MKICIQSRDGQLRAYVTDTSNGVSVDLYRSSRIDSRYLNDGMWKLTQRGMFDAPFHVVCDQVHVIIDGE